MIQRYRAKHPFVDLALGAESHIKRHLVHLAAARVRILSYMERGDVDSIDRATDGGFPVLRRIARNAVENKVGIKSCLDSRIRRRRGSSNS